VNWRLRYDILISGCHIKRLSNSLSPLDIRISQNPKLVVAIGYENIRWRFKSFSENIQCVAVCCSVLPCLAVCCSMLQRISADVSNHSLRISRQRSHIQWRQRVSSFETFWYPMATMSFSTPILVVGSGKISQSRMLYSFYTVHSTASCLWKSHVVIFQMSHMLFFLFFDTVHSFHSELRCCMLFTQYIQQRAAYRSHMRLIFWKSQTFIQQQAAFRSHIRSTNEKNPTHLDVIFQMSQIFFIFLKRAFIQ